MMQGDEQGMSLTTQNLLHALTDQLLFSIQPNAASELRRLSIAGWITDLIHKAFEPEHNVSSPCCAMYLCVKNLTAKLRVGAIIHLRFSPSPHLPSRW